MKFALIGDIHLGEESPHKGVVRKLSRYSLPLLAAFIDRVETEIKPEFVVNLGDMINDVDKEVDTKNLKIILKHFSQVSRPVFNLVGNHEQWTLSQSELETLLDQPSLFYSKEWNDYHLVFLHSEAFGGEDSLIGQEQLTWLQDDLSAARKPVLVFVHHTLADQDLTGNFWFDGYPDRALVSNREVVRKILEDSGKVRAVFNGHVHWTKIHEHNGIPYFTINSLVENINNDDVPANAYAQVQIDDERIMVATHGLDAETFTYKF